MSTPPAPYGQAARRLVLLAATAVTATAMTACSSASGTNSSHSSAPASGTSAPPASTAAGTTAAGTTAAGTNQPPRGSATTTFGQSSLVAFDDFTSDTTHPIRLTLSLQPGSLADLKGFQLDAQTKKSTPFYLTIQVTNVGTTPIDSSGFAGNLTVDDAAGDEVSSLTLLGDFAKCQGAIPDKLAPGASGHECDVYTAPQGDRVAKASIDNGSKGATITWS